MFSLKHRHAIQLEQEWQPDRSALEDWDRRFLQVFPPPEPPKPQCVWIVYECFASTYMHACGVFQAKEGAIAGAQETMGRQAGPHAGIKWRQVDGLSWEREGMHGRDKVFITKETVKP